MYSWRQAASISVIALLLAVHAAYWMTPVQVLPNLDSASARVALLVFGAPIAAFVTALALSAALALIGFTRFAAAPAHYTVRGVLTDRTVP